MLIVKKAGIDAINIPDGPRASSRISPLVTALMIDYQFFEQKANNDNDRTTIRF